MQRASPSDRTSAICTGPGVTGWLVRPVVPARTCGARVKPDLHAGALPHRVDSTHVHRVRPSSEAQWSNPRSVAPDQGVSTPVQPGRTNAALVAKRAGQARDAQALTSAIRNVRTWQELEHLYQQHRDSLNSIHFSALMTRLANLAGGKGTNSQSASSLRRQMPGVRAFLSVLVPYIGMHMLKLRPRQLSSVMWALGSLSYTPQPAWVVEWAGCTARALHKFTPQDIAMAAWGLAASGCAGLGRSSGAPGALAQLVLAAAQPGLLSQLQPQDVSNVCWALATAGACPTRELAAAVHVLVGHAHTLLPAAEGQQQHGPRASAAASDEREMVGAAVTSSVGDGRGGVALMAGPPGTGTSGTPGHASSTTTASTRSNDAAAADRETGRHHQLRYRPFQPDELVTLVWSLARMGVRPDDSFFTAATSTFLAATTATATHPHASTPNDLGGSGSPSSPHPLASHIVSFGGAGMGGVDAAGGAAAAAPRAMHAAGQSEHHRALARRAPFRQQPHLNAVLLWSAAKLRWRPSPEHISMLLDACLTPALPAPAPSAATGRSHAASLGSPVARQSSEGGGARGVQGSEVPVGPQRLAIAALAARMPVLRGEDVSQVMWALGRVRYRPAPRTHAQLLAATHAALVATAEQAGVEVQPTRRLRARGRQHGDVRVPYTSRQGKALRTARGVESAVYHAAVRTALSSSGAGETAASLSAQELAAVVWGLARLVQGTPGDLPPALRPALRAALTAAAPELAQVSTVRLLQLLCACASLQLALPPSCLAHVGDRVAHEVHAYGPAQLVPLLHSLAVLRQHLGVRPLLAIRRRVLELLTEHQAAHSRPSEASSGVPCAAPPHTSTRPPAPCAGSAVASPTQLVRALWALARLPRMALGVHGAEVVTQFAASAAPALRPAQLTRLLWVLRVLAVRPRVVSARAAVASCVATAAAQSTARGCDALCPVDQDAPCSTRACMHLRRVPHHVRTWLRALASQEQGTRFRRCRLLGSTRGGGLGGAWLAGAQE